MTKKAIFIGATGQNVGKTTTCLGIMSGLKKKFNNAGFIKPVGQKTIASQEGAVDKDVGLFKKTFHITSSAREMSPVVFPKGFTRKFLDGKIKTEDLTSQITKAYASLCDQHDFLLVEGTGHTGVGALCGVHNAAVAKLLDLDAVIITNGGLGKAYDEFILNKALYDQLGVRVRGVILNRILDSKQDMVREYFTRALKPFGIPLLGTIPLNNLLQNPTVKDFVDLFNTELISGHAHLLWHFEHFRIVGTTLERYQEVMVPNQLVITPATREDIIFAKLKQHENTSLSTDDGIFGGGVLLTGLVPPSKRVLEALKNSTLPSLYAEVSAYDAMREIHHFTAKIREEDAYKITKAMRHVEPHIDFTKLLEGY